jgi:membrane protease YdiL (CAAX protease family)
MPLFVHLYVLVLIVALPIYSYASYQRVLRAYRAGEPVNRLTVYRTTIATQWLLFAVTVVLLTSVNVEAKLIGATWHFDFETLIGAILALAILAVLIGQWLMVQRSSGSALAEYAGSHQDLVMMLPQTKRELQAFYAVSVTAGIVEEVLWRGFLVWYLAHYMPMWAALLVSLLAFTCAHAYQGVKQLPGIFLVGAVLTAMYWLTGSLWPCIVLHIAIDAIQGRTANDMLMRTQTASPAKAQ